MRPKLTANEMKWFVVRVPFCRELKLQKALDEANVISFIPTKTVYKEKDGSRTSETIPVIHNLIFIYTTRNNLKCYKEQFQDSIPFRYIIDKSKNAPLIVPDKQMDSFMRVCRSNCDDLIFLDDNINKHCVPGQLVRVLDGPFKDVEGYVVRIRKDRRVVVNIKGIGAVATTYIDSSLLYKLNTQ